MCCGRERVAQPMGVLAADSGAPDSIAVAEAPEVFYEVWVGDRFSGRRFDSNITATRYASQLRGAEVRVSAPSE